MRVVLGGINVDMNIVELVATVVSYWLALLAQSFGRLLDYRYW